MPKRRSRKGSVDFLDRHHTLLNEGVDVWNRWRTAHPAVTPQLRFASLTGADLRYADLSGADLMLASLREANLEHANLRGAVLRGAELSGASLDEATLIEAEIYGAKLGRARIRRAKLNKAILDMADMQEADLSGADLSGASLNQANLTQANLSEARFANATMLGAILSEASLEGADLSHAKLNGAILDMAKIHKTIAYETDFIGANLFQATIAQTLLIGANLSRANLHGSSIVNSSLEYAILVEADLSRATLVDTSVYGISAWGLNLADISKQLNLRVTPNREGEPAITVDNVEVAQFVYLLLHNERIRNAIDTIGKKGVLILGRFTPERKAVLDAIRNTLRELDYVPMMFDFEKPTQRDFTETIKTLAGLSRFIVADITNPKSSPLELQATMPDYMIPFVPIIHESEEPFAMFRDLKQKYGDWVLDVLEYDSAENLVAVLDDAIVKPALEAADRLTLRKAEALQKRHVRDYR